MPQGSVLGPILYVLYTSPLGDIVKSHGLSCHFYADDNQLYCSFKLHDQAASVQAIESCLNDIDAWMLANMLKLNRDKTELLVIGPKHKVNPPIKGIHVAGEYIEVSNNARNIGVIFDSHVNLEKHVMNTCKTALYHLRKIAKIRNLRIMLKHLFMHLFHLSCISVMLFNMAYINRLLIGYSMYKTAQLDW